MGETITVTQFGGSTFTGVTAIIDRNRFEPMHSPDGRFVAYRARVSISATEITNHSMSAPREGDTFTFDSKAWAAESIEGGGGEAYYDINVILTDPRDVATGNIRRAMG